MAFPTGYTKYQDITIDHLKVAADLTDYIVYINLADLVKAGADIFDTCRTDGGDIRATKTDGSTELAVEVVAIDTTAKTGEIHVKFSGTLSSSTDTVIRIWYNGTDTLPAATDTYGRNNVWTDYVAVYHLQTSSIDSKGTYNGTDTSITYAAAKIQSGASYNANTDRISLGNNTAFEFGEANSFTIQSWYNAVSRATNNFLFGRQDGSGGANFRGYSLYINSTGGNMRWDMYSDLGAGGNNTRDWSSVIAANSVNYMLHLVSTGTSTAAGINLYRDGSLQTATTVTDTLTGSTAVTRNYNIGNRDGSNFGPSATFDEHRVRATALSANWITTEYNNQNSSSTFYAAGAELGGSTIVSPSAQVLTFSLPQETITAGAVLGVNTQNATFSIPAYAVSGAALVSVGPQVATFSLPAFTIIAAGVAFSPTVQALTFTVPTYSVLTGATFSPDTQALTFSLPTSTVSGAALVGVNPAVLTLTIPALEFVGALWGRTARATSGADWIRTSINNDA